MLELLGFITENLRTKGALVSLRHLFPLPLNVPASTFCVRHCPSVFLIEWACAVASVSS